MKKLLFVMLISVTVPVVPCGDIDEIFRDFNIAQHSINSRLVCSSCNTSTFHQLMRLDCCGAILCKSCWEGRLGNALHNRVSPVCKICGAKLAYDVATQRQALAQFEKPKPSAPPAELRNNNIKMCASNCDTPAQVNLQCKGGHWMCASCLKSRVQTAKKAAQREGRQISVICPVPSCGAIPTCVINPYIN